MSIKKTGSKTTGTSIQPSHPLASGDEQCFTQIAQSVDATEEEEDEAADIRAWISRNLRTRLMGAGLLNPNRVVTPESEALEAKLRQEAQMRLDDALASLARRQEKEKPRASEHIFMAAQAMEWVRELRLDAADPASPPQIREDWEKIAEWAGFRDDSLNDTGLKKIRDSFIGYLSLGEAPSLSLEGSFSHFAAELADQTDLLIPPPNIRGIFDRLLASDIEIQRKNAASAADTMMKHFNARAEKSKKPVQIDQKRSRVGKLAFLYSAWVFVILSVIWLSGQDLSELDSDDSSRVLFVCIMPLIAWAGSRIYKKLA